MSKNAEDLSNDSAVQGTTEEASVSKLSSAQLGYFEDSHLAYFVKQGTYRRSPLVNRGYYTRVSGIRKCVTSFFQCCEDAGYPTAQLVNLGAGLDSMAFWLATGTGVPEIVKESVLFEVDHAEVVTKKSALINKHKELSNVFADTNEPPMMRADQYRLIAADLRDVQSLDSKLKEAGMQRDIPTLFLAECVLIYMQPEFSNKILSWIAKDAVSDAFTAIVVYEQTMPDDPFGRVMVENLKMRGCGLLGIHEFPTLESERSRFIEINGFDKVSIADMNQIFDSHIDKDEVRRVCKLEMFDEFEEWRLMQAHYFIAVASKFRKHSDRINFNALSDIWSDRKM